MGVLAQQPPPSRPQVRGVANEITLGMLSIGLPDFWTGFRLLESSLGLFPGGVLDFWGGRVILPLRSSLVWLQIKL